MASSSLTREELYELVWSEPMLKVAARELMGSTEALEHFVQWRTPDEIYTPEL